MTTKRGSKPRILVVDDMPANIKLLSGILRPEYQAVAATDGPRALEMAASDAQPDLVLLDIIMPGMNGYEVCKRLKADPRTRDIPVVFITALSEESDEAMGLGLGAADYITKPFRPHIVKARVGNLLRLKEEMDLGRRLAARQEEMNRNLEDLVRQRTLELEDANRQLRDLDRMKSAFMSAVSHELRTPLTAVRGFSELALKDFSKAFAPEPPTRRKTDPMCPRIDRNLRVIVVESKRLQRLINNVILLTALDTDLVEWDMGLVAVEDIVADAVAEARDALDKDNLAFEQEVEPGLPAVFGDRKRLVQVLAHLLSNAANFTPKGRVACRASRSGGEVVLSVQDTGVGIEPKILKHIFERYRRVGDLLSGQSIGLGLGLPISKAIVEHHGGGIRVESEPDKGSTFTFTLPLVEPQRAD
ncbi:MAG: hybrid sensor histidine kinase/response regulator [Thermodesulfobacteriota bacterium]